MRKALRWLGFALLLVLAVVGAAAAYVAVAPIPRYPVVKVDFPVDFTPERVARGKRSVEMLCAGCHMDSATGGLTGKRMLDLPAQFGEAWSLNITAHPAKGIGGWTNGEIARLLRTGVGRDGRYTPPWMVKLPNLSDEDLRDIIAFLRSDDPLVQARDVDGRESKPSFLGKVLCQVTFKPFPYPTREAYGCNGCHGDTGEGQYDLRRGPLRYPTDDELIAWIKHPERLRPGITMPTWEGVIKEEEYPPLAAYVRSLAKSAPVAASVPAVAR